MILKTADEAVQHTVFDCLTFGLPLEATKGDTYEILNYTTGMTNPRARIMTHASHPLNVTTAVARFVWLIAGNNRLEDIALYEPKVRGYTDDELTVPGSSYGARLFNAAPGLNQIEGVVRRLMDKPSTRQASAVVWLPQDAVRESADIPCTFGFFFHIRNDALHMTTVMRSNNAFRLLPFNLFEFTLLQETLATTLGVELGEYTHWAASQHVYARDNDKGVRYLADSEPGVSIEMSPMPPGNALEQADLLAQFEGKLRHTYSQHEFNQVVKLSETTLNEYWYGLFMTLVVFHAMRREYLTRYAQQVPDWLRVK